MGHRRSSRPTDPGRPRGVTCRWHNVFHPGIPRFGALSNDHSVVRISQCDEVPGGSTGPKLLLRVEYDTPSAAPTGLFVKFSRDSDDPIRDRGKTQVEAEVLFASLSRESGFPITVPAAVFADYHRDTGTGILASERIQLGSNGIERQYDKCVDYEMPDPREHKMNVAMALWGAMSGGGPELSGPALRDQIILDTALTP